MRRVAESESFVKLSFSHHQWTFLFPPEHKFAHCGLKRRRWRNKKEKHSVEQQRKREEKAILKS